MHIARLSIAAIVAISVAACAATPETGQGAKENTGTLMGAMLLGIVESFTSTFYGPSWAPAVSFGLLLLTLAFRPAGLMGR